jgi:hypothetical protein
MEKGKAWVGMGRRCEGVAAAKAIESDSSANYGSENGSSNSTPTQQLPGSPTSEKQMRNDF